MALTNAQCLSAKGAEKPYKLTDAAGLYLEVHPNGSRYWLWQYRIASKRSRISLGVYPKVTLKEAREKRDDYRKLLDDGVDPAHHRKRQKLQRNLELGTVFESVARDWHEVNRSRWTQKTAADILYRLEKDVFPSMGNLPLADVTPADVLSTLRKIERRGALELTKKARQYICRTYRFAIASGLARYNPAEGLTDALKPRPRPKHQPAISADELPEFLVSLRTNTGRLYPMTLSAIEILMQTFVRTGELIGATWTEIDFDRDIWIIPAERMKMGKDHLVPLSRQVKAEFQKLFAISGQQNWVFPGHTWEKPLSNNTVLKGLGRMGYSGRMTGHGFRALAMSTIKERLGYRHEVIDRQLAHAHKSMIDAAYDRAQFLDERKAMMQEWSDYLDQAYKAGLLRDV